MVKKLYETAIIGLHKGNAENSIKVLWEALNFDRKELTDDDHKNISFGRNSKPFYHVLGMQLKESPCNLL